MRAHLHAIFPAAAVSLLGALPAAAPGAGSAKQQVHEILVDGWMRSGWSEEVVVDELAALGSKAIPSLFGIHAGQDFEPWTAAEGALGFERSPERGAALAGQALQALPAQRVVEYLDHNARPQDTSEIRLAALGLYSAVGTAEDLDHCLALVASFSEEEQLEAHLRRRLPGDLAQLFERAPSAALLAAEDFEGLDPLAQRPLVEAFFTMDHPVGIQALPTLMGQDSKQDIRVIARLSELGSQYPWQLQSSELFLARSLIAERDWTIRRATCVLVANWHQLELFEELVRLHEEDPQPAVQRSAQWALHELSRSELELDAEGWMHWLETQVQAWEDEVDVLAENVLVKNPAIVSEALRRLSRFPLHRHEAAVLVASALEEHPELADTIASVLIELDSRRAVPFLVDYIELSELAEDERPRQIAWMTLKHLTGRDLRIDDPTWTTLAFD